MALESWFFGLGHIHMQNCKEKCSNKHFYLDDVMVLWRVESINGIPYGVKI